MTLAEERVTPDEAAVIDEFIAFLKAASLRRAGDGPVQRFNQARASGCVDAEFIVRDDLADHLRVGIFAQARRYPAFIRFANATSKSDRQKDTRGMSIKLTNVPGSNLTEGSSDQDFVLNSHPVMVAPDTKEFLDLLRAIEGGPVRTALYFASHPRLLRTARASRGRPTSHLDIPFWSTTPFAFGDGRAVKYIARPCSSRTSEMPAKLTDHYLRDAIQAHLREAEACFDFFVQFQVDAERTPIEDASIEWREEDSPYVAVARIRIPPQAVADDNRCERATFNPWHSLAEHRPLGNMNRARKPIYRALAEFRRVRDH
jgi:hypothetical protein